MKKRIIALLLLLIFALAACSSSPELKKEGKDPNSVRPSRGSSARQDAQQPTEQVLKESEVDIGAVNGNVYTNVALGITASFPRDWTVRSGSLINSDDSEADTLDRAAVADAVEAGQDIVFFSACDAEMRSYVTISVSKNPLPGEDPDALVNHFAPQIKELYAQSASTELTRCDPLDVDFCGEDHVVLAISFEKEGLAATHIKTMYLPDGNLLYTLSVSTDSEDTTAELLNLFEAFN